MVIGDDGESTSAQEALAFDMALLVAELGRSLDTDGDLDAALATLSSHCEAVCQAAVANDAPTTVRACAQLRGSADKIGATRMSALCRRVALTANRADVRAAEDTLAELLDELDTIWTAGKQALTSACAHSGLSPRQQAALIELLSIGVGCAAGKLNGLAGQRVVLTAPELEPANTPAQPGSEDCVVELAFRGGFSGRVSLLFSAEDSNTLASLMAQGDWIAPEELHEFKMETLDEVGNILANALIGSISTLLGETVTYTPPQSSDVRGRDTQIATAEGTACFRFRTAFSGEVPGTQGRFVVSVDVEDLSRFLERLSA